MSTQIEYDDYEQYDQIRQILRELGIPVHRKGYKQLAIAVLFYLRDDSQSLTKEIYPHVAKATGTPDWRLVERSTRSVIQYAWEHGDPDVWHLHFPRSQKAPSNKLFITVLTELLQ